MPFDSADEVVRETSPKHSSFETPARLGLNSATSSLASKSSNAATTNSAYASVLRSKLFKSKPTVPASPPRNRLVFRPTCALMAMMILIPIMFHLMMEALMLFILLKPP